MDRQDFYEIQNSISQISREFQSRRKPISIQREISSSHLRILSIETKISQIFQNILGDSAIVKHIAGGDWLILIMSEKRGHGNWNVICEKVFYTFVSLLFKHLIESCKILKSFIELDLIRINGLAKICNMGWSVLDPSLLSNQIFKGGIANKILNSNPDLWFFHCHAKQIQGWRYLERQA